MRVRSAAWLLGGALLLAASTSCSGTDPESGRDREVFHLLAHFPNGCNGRSCTDPKPGARSLLWISHPGCLPAHRKCRHRQGTACPWTGASLRGCCCAVTAACLPPPLQALLSGLPRPAPHSILGGGARFSGGKSEVLDVRLASAGGWSWEPTPGTDVGRGPPPPGHTPLLLPSVFALGWAPAPGEVGAAAEMPTQLEMAMDTMIRIFHRYSCKEGDRFKLSKRELKLLLQRELTEFLSCQKDPQLVDKIMHDLDANKDNEVDFNEFVVMVAALTVACNDYFVEQLKKKERERHEKLATWK
ncbi:uncharacterized protein LOC133774657 isoform X3 [Lepus europaeus]|uniref:uncharacterized protein LOC133774657 isoform X3 n=2 Tax=Lepus europaeus TaxID=9983 RepID=UPI002B45CFFC|nr:uncharacterized protein LOC133774657 isoform X3 [Lepus europaeus]XP_062068536.1 uncharacterized protein LOC133774657 isoform X3 [Lepus europaeus]